MITRNLSTCPSSARPSLRGLRVAFAATLSLMTLSCGWFDDQLGRPIPVDAGGHTGSGGRAYADASVPGNDGGVPGADGGPTCTGSGGVAGGGGGVAGGGAGGGTRALDLLVMVDDSASMTGLQAKFAARLPDFIQVLDSFPHGRPDLHIAVVSSSLGAGIFGNVTGCMPGHPGNDDGMFQVPPECAMVHPGEHFLRAASDPSQNNFDGDLAAAFGCIANLGASGCGFEHQFASTQVALERSLLVGDANAGFLRPNAVLVVMFLTNEDDCSVSPDSMLFDPSQESVRDRLGGLASYRCNEFGHLCSGVAPPHQVSGSTTLMNCESAEDRGSLITVKSFTDFLFGLKPGRPDLVFTAAIAGPYVPNATAGQLGAYTVVGHNVQLPRGATENQPGIAHSCQATNPGDFGDPAVRISQWITQTNGLFESICSDDFKPALQQVGAALSGP